MSIAMAVELRNLKQEDDALVMLVRTLAAEVDALKRAMPEPVRRGRPPKDSYERY